MLDNLLGFGVKIAEKKIQDEEWASLPVARHIKHTGRDFPALSRLGDLLIRAGNDLKERFEVHNPDSTLVTHP